MFTVTESAAAIIDHTLKAHRQTEGDVFRVSHAGDGLALTMDEQREEDVVVRHQDRAVLVLERSVVDAIGDAIIDTDAADGTRLVIKPADVGDAV